MALTWLGHDGLLVLLAASQAKGWLGPYRPLLPGDAEDTIETFGPKRMVRDDDLEASPPRTDYTRALAALPPGVAAALVPFTGGVALALGATGHQTAMLPSPGGLLVARLLGAPDEAHAGDALGRLPDDLPWHDTRLLWRIPTKGVSLHAAAARHESTGPRAPLPPGTYRVESATWTPDRETSLALWRLVPGR